MCTNKNKLHTQFRSVGLKLEMGKMVIEKQRVQSSQDNIFVCDYMW